MTALTAQQARAVIAPWHSQFNIATRGDVRAIQEAALTDGYGSCASHLPGECRGMARSSIRNMPANPPSTLKAWRYP
jgi:hypothetical protein